MAERILNIGCGSDTYGTDFVDLYPLRDEVKRCDIDNEKLPYKDGTFDEVYSRCVFEHLRNPGMALEEMRRVLKKGGKLKLITDNANYWLYNISKLHLGGYENKSQIDVEDKHYALFTPWHLENHLKDAGFNVESTRYSNFHGDRRMIVLLSYAISSLFYITPFWRAAKPRVEIVGTKSQ